MGKQKHFVCEFFRILLKEEEEKKKRFFTHRRTWLINISTVVLLTTVN